MRKLKEGLFRALGRQNYLWMISQGYFVSYRLGLLRRDPAYRWHYFAKNLVRPGDHVMDIGANLGYFSALFAEWVGPGGRVWSVEPVPLYRRVLAQHLRGKSQAVIVPYAFGPQAGTATMGIPGPHAHRHGLTRLLDETDGVEQVIKVNMRRPEEVFPDLERLDYIKCDVEGYEAKVLPLLRSFILEHRPLVQVEIDPAHREGLFRFFSGLGYRAAALDREGLRELQDWRAPCEGDTLFYPSDRRPDLSPWFQKETAS